VSPERDHLDVADGSDGNLDVTQGSDFVTISWTRSSYSPDARRDGMLSGAHRFSNLVGADDHVAEDQGHLNITFHHNWWAERVDQRAPRTRAGMIHVFNNLYTSAGNSYSANAGMQAKLLVENNVFIGVNSPHTVSTDPLGAEGNGQLLSTGNAYEQTSGSRQSTGVGFTPPYAHTLDETSSLEAAIREGARQRP
jgi:pectate lyase